MDQGINWVVDQERQKAAAQQQQADARQRAALLEEHARQQQRDTLQQQRDIERQQTEQRAELALQATVARQEAAAAAARLSLPSFSSKRRLSTPRCNYLPNSRRIIWAQEQRTTEMTSAAADNATRVQIPSTLLEGQISSTTNFESTVSGIQASVGACTGSMTDIAKKMDPMLSAMTVVKTAMGVGRYREPEPAADDKDRAYRPRSRSAKGRCADDTISEASANGRS